MFQHRNTSQAGFTIVDVMLASVILVVGFLGLIQTITIGSEMLATARRETLAAQIINHELEKLRFSNWTALSALTTTTATTYVSDNPAINTAIAASGVSFTLARTVTTLTTNLNEVTLAVQWTKGGTTTDAPAPTGSWLNRLAFYRESPISRTYTRMSSAWFGKYGLNLTYQRS